MALRLIELHLPKEQTANIQELLKDHQVLGIWHDTEQCSFNYQRHAYRPLLGPNVAFCVATTLALRALARNALKASTAGVFMALVISVSIGFPFPINTQNYEIASRAQVGLGDVVLALASGSVGAFAFTSVVPAMLTGVMFSVALLPPLVVFGLLLVGGNALLALGSMFLLFPFGHSCF